MATDERQAAMDRLASAQRAAARLAEHRRRDPADVMLETLEEAAQYTADLRRARETADVEAHKRRAEMHAIEGGDDV